MLAREAQASSAPPPLAKHERGAGSAEAGHGATFKLSRRGLRVDLTGLAKQAGRYSIDWGDGSAETGQPGDVTSSHTYRKPGTYVVTFHRRGGAPIHQTVTVRSPRSTGGRRTDRPTAT